MLKTIRIIFFISFCPFFALSQSNGPKFREVCKLPPDLNESSGLALTREGDIISHNDSGANPYIHCFRTGNPLGSTLIRIKEEKNYDWEELADDDKFLYIGDFGNNLGARENLMIYRVKKASIERRKKTTAEKIQFSYPEQKVFKARQFHNFDCEAMFAFENKLYLFTKNRADFHTQLYKLPNDPGQYEAELLDTFDVAGLITGADINDAGNVVALIGYVYLGNNRFNPFITLFYEFEGADFFNGKSRRIDLPVVKQTEAICFKDDHTILFSEEEENLNTGYLFEMDISAYLKR